jgi:hypothetical protein
LESLAAPSVCGAAGASPLGGEAGLVSEQHPVPPIVTAELDRATGVSGLRSAEIGGAQGGTVRHERSPGPHNFTLAVASRPWPSAELTGLSP